MTDRERSLERLSSRWTFSGEIEAVSAVHVGNGMSGGLVTDQPIVRDALDRPYLPASTIKGAVRACVDRVAPVVGADRRLRSCGLSLREEDCPSPPGSPAYLAVESALREFRGAPREREAQLLGLLEARLCATCRLFGSPWLAGRLFFADGVAGSPDVPVEFRDGLGIDRDSGLGRESYRYSYEAIPSTLRFSFQLDAENLDEGDQAVLALALSEWQRGALRFGGGGGHGLGDCRLRLQQVASIDFAAASPEERRAYVLTGERRQHQPADWLSQSLGWFFINRNETAGA